MSEFDIGPQYGGSISNVGRDQYNYHRDSLLREIAVTRTRGRRLIGLGALVIVVGFVMFASVILRFMATAADAVSNGRTAPPVDPFGSEIAGLPSGLLGWAIAMAGTLMLIVGVVLHVVATARRRRVDRDLPQHPRGGERR